MRIAGSVPAEGKQARQSPAVTGLMSAESLKEPPRVDYGGVSPTFGTIHSSKASARPGVSVPLVIGLGGLLVGMTISRVYAYYTSTR